MGWKHCSSSYVVIKEDKNCGRCGTLIPKNSNQIFRLFGELDGEIIKNYTCVKCTDKTRKVKEYNYYKDENIIIHRKVELV